MLKSGAQCELTLGMLMRRIDIARHVRHLVVRLYTRGDMSLDNQVSSASVRRVAVTKVLDALVRFDWDGEELPSFEDMWFALRLGCVHDIFLRVLRKSNGGYTGAPNCVISPLP